MSDNNRSVNSEQMRNLRLRQPHAVVLHANVQAGLAVCRLVNDNLPSVHRNKDTNKPEISKIRRSDYFTATQIRSPLPKSKGERTATFSSTSRNTCNHSPNSICRHRQNPKYSLLPEAEAAAPYRPG